jgi:hypothetical protein
MNFARVPGPFAIAFYGSLGASVWAAGCGCSEGASASATLDASGAEASGDVTVVPGKVVVMGTVTGCPTIVSMTVPAQLAVGASTPVSAVIQVPGGAAPTLKWTASSGTFLNPGQPSTFFTCTTVGMDTITLTATIGTCSDTLSGYISCISDD